LKRIAVHEALEEVVECVEVYVLLEALRELGAHLFEDSGQESR